MLPPLCPPPPPDEEEPRSRSVRPSPPPVTARLRLGRSGGRCRGLLGALGRGGGLGRKGFVRRRCLLRGLRGSLCRGLRGARCPGRRGAAAVGRSGRCGLRLRRALLGITGEGTERPQPCRAEAGQRADPDDARDGQSPQHALPRSQRLRGADAGGPPSTHAAPHQCSLLPRECVRGPAYCSRAPLPHSSGVVLTPGPRARCRLGARGAAGGRSGPSRTDSVPVRPGRRPDASATARAVPRPGRSAALARAPDLWPRRAVRPAPRRARAADQRSRRRSSERRPARIRLRLSRIE